MTELTHEQANSMLAEMMGWGFDGYSWRDAGGKGDIRITPTPTTNPAHALQALEAYAKLPEMCYSITNDVIAICHRDRAKCWRTSARVDRPEGMRACLAITTALCSAISGVQVRIV